MSTAALAALTVLGGASTLIGLLVGIDRATARRQPARSDWPHADERSCPVDYDDEPSPWVDEDGYDRTPGRDLDRIGGWL